MGDKKEKEIERPSHALSVESLGHKSYRANTVARLSCPLCQVGVFKRRKTVNHGNASLKVTD